MYGGGVFRRTSGGIELVPEICVNSKDVLFIYREDHNESNTRVGKLFSFLKS